MPGSAFIEPSSATTASAPPFGPEWLHEIKHDGWGTQLHLSDGQVVIYSRKGVT
jgi:bifunctional non-homologous end joining protein LigD